MSEYIAAVFVDQIDESPNNPRKVFDPAKMAELVESIREKGILQPVLLRTNGKGYELVCGHRRVRAAREAGREAPGGAGAPVLDGYESGEELTMKPIPGVANSSDRREIALLQELVQLRRRCKIQEAALRDQARKQEEPPNPIFDAIMRSDIKGLARLLHGRKQ